MNEEIKQYIDQKIREHDHSGHDSKSINLFSIFGVFETVSAAPTVRPSGPYDQIKIYVNGATLRLYAYDTTAGVWHYITFSA